MNSKFFIIKGKNKNCSVYVRFWDSKRIDQKTRTGISVLFEDWSETKQRLKPKATSTKRDFFNDQLEKLERHIFDSYNSDYISKNTFQIRGLKIL